MWGGEDADAGSDQQGWGALTFSTQHWDRLSEKAVFPLHDLCKQILNVTQGKN
jgi:hypothetical protein